MKRKGQRPPSAPPYERVKNLGNFAHPPKRQTRVSNPKLIHKGKSRR